MTFAIMLQKLKLAKKNNEKLYAYRGTSGREQVTVKTANDGSPYLHMRTGFRNIFYQPDSHDLMAKDWKVKGW